MCVTLKQVKIALIILAGGLAAAFVFGGWPGVFLVAVLAGFEVAMSFNNAIVNAAVLEKMNRFWRRMFMTVGLVIAVIGMRLLFPVAIVSATAGLAFARVVRLALHHPALYASHLRAAHPLIAAFGSMFLLMLCLDFLIDRRKHVHWIEVIEKPLARGGRFKVLPVVICLCVLGIASAPVAGVMRGHVIMAGVVGLGIYLAVRAIGRLFLEGTEESTAKATGWAGFVLFMYLEVLDSSFSLDGVVGAFAITTNVLTIALGLGIGALFVRELTVLLVRKQLLDRFIYLEHGAQYSVGFLAIILAVGLVYNVPGLLTGLIGVGVIAAAMVSSMAERNHQVL